MSKLLYSFQSIPFWFIGKKQNEQANKQTNTLLTWDTGGILPARIYGKGQKLSLGTSSCASRGDPTAISKQEESLQQSHWYIVKQQCHSCSDIFSLEFMKGEMRKIISSSYNSAQLNKTSESVYGSSVQLCSYSTWIKIWLCSINYVMSEKSFKLCLLSFLQL